MRTKKKQQREKTIWDQIILINILRKIRVGLYRTRKVDKMILQSVI